MNRKNSVTPLAAIIWSLGITPPSIHAQAKQNND
jgi:hypothetical protein